MPSTRRNRRDSGIALTALGIVATLVAAIVVIVPEPPNGPRYSGAGHEEPQYGGTFVFFHESDVRTFDPHIAFDQLSNMGIKLLFEGLIDYDRDTVELVPRLAIRLPEVSEDGRTLRFELRRGVRFQDSPVFANGRGREIVAEDVRWSMEHMLASETGSPGYPFYALIEGVDRYRAGEAEHIAGIRVLDRYTVEFQLARADQTFLYAMAMTFAYPVAREAYEHFGENIGRFPVSTGAYRLGEWEPGVRITFDRNPNFFDAPRPYVDRMIYELNLSRIAAVMRFRNGELDHIHRSTPADYVALKDMERWAPYRIETPLTTMWGVTMNCELAPFDNIHVRRAVAFSINRERWRRARSNRLLITGQPVPRQIPGYDPALPGQHRYDLTRAREEMRLAGYPDGIAEPVDLWIGEGETGRMYGELIQADLREIGLNVRIRQVAFPIYLQQTGRRRTVQLALGGWSMDFPDASNFLDTLFHTRSIHENDSENRAFYSNPELDALLDRARIEQNRTQRLAMYRQASEMVVRDAPWAFVFTDLAMEMWQPYVRNYQPHPVWSNFYRDIWLDLPRRRIAALWEQVHQPFAILPHAWESVR